MFHLYKKNLSIAKPNTRFKKFESDLKNGVNKENKRKLICDYEIDFNHSSLQYAITNENIEEILRLLSEFISFYTKYKFVIDENNILSIQLILSIIEQRDQVGKDLINKCFEAICCLFLSKIDPIILIDENILDLLQYYLENPKIDDIIPSLKIIKYLIMKENCDITFEQLNIFIFKEILYNFNHKDIDKTIQPILMSLYKETEKKYNNGTIYYKFYQKNICELFDSALYVLNKEIRKFHFRNQNHNCNILSLYLDLFYNLLKNNGAICPDLNAKIMGNSMSPISFFNYILKECHHNKPAATTLLIVTEIINSHFKYLDFETITYTKTLLLAQNHKVQSLAIYFFFTLIQVISNENESDQIQSYIKHISDLDLFSDFCNLLKADDLYFNSIDYTIQSIDILIDLLSDEDLIQNIDQEMVEQLCVMIDGNLKTDTLNSILNIFINLNDYLASIDIDQRNCFVQVLMSNINPDTLEIFLQSERKDLINKAQAFFDQIHEIASSYSEIDD